MLPISKRSKSILEEISSFIPNGNKEDLVESRAQHIITSAINLFETIDDNFTEAEADALKKRFMSSIRGADPSRFTRMINRVRYGTDVESGGENNLYE